MMRITNKKIIMVFLKIKILMYRIKFNMKKFLFTIKIIIALEWKELLEILIIIISRNNNNKIFKANNNFSRINYKFK